ncbi:MAG: type II toxin-antitoxin system RelE/ParE family toxin [Pyrinomonadaceae bacterium]
MNRTFEIRPAAELEFDEASDWYNGEDPAVRDRFIASVDTRISAIIQKPLAFPVVEGTKIRRAVVDGFPYSLFFVLDGNHVVILSIFHTSRNPMIWRARV